MPVVGTIGTDTILIGLVGFGFDIAIGQGVGRLNQLPCAPLFAVFHSAVDLVAGGFGNRAPF